MPERLTRGKVSCVEDVCDWIKLGEDQFEPLVQAGAFVAVDRLRNRREADGVRYTVMHARASGTRACWG